MQRFPFSRLLASCCAVIAFICGMLTPAAAQSNTAGRRAEPLSVGAARIDITPDEPIRLSGYGGRSEVHESIEQKLWAKALAIGGPGEDPVVLITADLIGIPGYVTRAVAENLEEKTGVRRSRFAIMVTHTHTGPEVGLLLNHFGERMPPAELAAIDRYVEGLTDKLERVALDALSNRRPGHLAWGQGSVSFGVNRRMLKDGHWTGFGVVPDGPVDHDVPILRVMGEDGQLRAVLINYASHNTTLGGDFNRVHGDWAGEAAALIEEAHPGAVAMVASGAGGDINPEPRGSLEDVRTNGEAMAAEVNRLLESPLQPLSTVPEGRIEWIDLPFEDVPTREELVEHARGEGRMAFYSHTMLERMARGREIPTELSYPIQTLTFGDDLAMVLLGGEVVVDYSLRLKSELDADRLWVSAYANAVPCYIASKRVIREGGYEVSGSMPSYDRPSNFSVEIEDMIVNTVHELLPRSFNTDG